MSIKNYELSIEGLQRLEASLDKIRKIFVSDDFKEFIGAKCVSLVKEISAERLSSGVDLEDSHAYMQSHKFRIEEDTIVLYNDSQIDMASKSWMSEDKLANYEATLSLGMILEYGIGYTGSIGSNIEDDPNWVYDKNGHGSSGWYYQDKSGDYVWTNGYAGKQIYARLMQRLDDVLSDWISDYLDKIED